MKSGWAQIFSKPRKTPQIEKHPYRCVICNSDSARFSFARTYACHMKAFHSFHDGYDLSLPEPSARKGYVLPKIEKKNVKKKPVFANKEEALQHVRSKSKKRHKKKKEDYESLIQGYEKAKKEGKIEQWANENQVKNPAKRVYSWRQSILKQAKESEV